MARSIRIAAAGSEAKAIEVVRALRDPYTSYFTGGGTPALVDGGKLSNAIRDEAVRRGYAGDQVVGESYLSLHAMEVNVIEGRSTLFNKMRGQMGSQPAQGWGYVFETTQNGKIVRGEIFITDAQGRVQRLGLHSVSEDGMKVFISENGALVEYKANVDALTTYENGLLIVTDFKAGSSSTLSTPEKLDLMERQAAVAWKNAKDRPDVFANELHWRFEKSKPPSETLVSYAKHQMGERPGLDIRFFDADGVEFLIV